MVKSILCNQGISQKEQGTPMTQAKQHNSNLDLVRLLAVFLVFVVHLGQGFSWIGEWSAVGAKGVLLFFVLSGYLISQSIDNSVSWKDYFKKRILRILPAYYIVLILMYLWDLLQYTVAWGFSEALAGPCHPLKYLRYFGFLQVILPEPDYTLWCNRYALWTMSSFAVFYLVAYPLRKVVKKYWQMLVLLFIFMVSRDAMLEGIQEVLNSLLPYVDGYYAHHTPLTMLYCFLFGTTLHYAVKEKKEFSYLFIMAAILVVGQFTWYRFEMIFTILLYLALKAPDLLAEGKSKRWIQMAGEGSFSFYLCHMMIFSMLDYVVKRLPLGDIGDMIVSVATTILAGYGLWWFAVRPVERWLQRKLQKT